MRVCMWVCVSVCVLARVHRSAVRARRHTSEKFGAVDVVSFFSTKKEEKYIMSAPLKGTTGNPVSAPGQTLIFVSFS